MKTTLLEIIDLASSGKWTKAHDRLQNTTHPLGDWIHAVLHREEGDLSNARYWYNKSQKEFIEIPLQEEYAMIKKEIEAMS